VICRTHCSLLTMCDFMLSSAHLSHFPLSPSPSGNLVLFTGEQFPVSVWSFWKETTSFSQCIGCFILLVTAVGLHLFHVEHLALELSDLDHCEDIFDYLAVFDQCPCGCDPTVVLPIIRPHCYHLIQLFDQHPNKAHTKHHT